MWRIRNSKSFTMVVCLIMVLTMIFTPIYASEVTAGTVSIAESGVSISNLVVYDVPNAADWSIQSNLQPGDLIFGDRTVTFTSVIPSMLGKEWIRPANDSKTYDSEPLCTFTVTCNANVYIAHNNIITPKPLWMADYTNTGETFMVGTLSYTLFRKVFAANSVVSLGKNGAGATLASTYIIIVDPIIGATPISTSTPSPTATPTRVPTITPDPLNTPNPIKHIYIAGDSTAETQPDSSLLKGFGQELGLFFDSNIIVDNRAISGYSSKSFVDNGKLNSILNEIKYGDYLFISFGHNDQKIDIPSVYTDPYTTYKSYLSQYITGARAKGAIPILITSVNRRTFDANGIIVNSLGEYPAAMRQLGTEMYVPVIDLNARSKVLFESYGSEGSKQLFYWVNGSQDDTHFQERGAIAVANLIVDGIRQDVGSPLSDHILASIPTPTPTELPTPTSTTAATQLPTPTSTTAATQTPTATSTPVVTNTPGPVIPEVMSVIYYANTTVLEMQFNATIATNLLTNWDPSKIEVYIGSVAAGNKLGTFARLYLTNALYVANGTGFAYLAQEDLKSNNYEANGGVQVPYVNTSIPVSSVYIRMTFGGANRVHQLFVSSGSAFIFRFLPGAVKGANGIYSGSKDITAVRVAIAPTPTPSPVPTASPVVTATSTPTRIPTITPDPLITPNPIKHIYIAGDSTAETRSDYEYPAKGFGQVLGNFFDQNIVVNNRAISGFSSKSFVDYGYLNNILNEIKYGDYLFICFGHNDQKPDPIVFTDPYTTYQSYLAQYINGARAKGAIPVLITSVNRRTFDSGGLITNSLGDYPAAMKQLGTEMYVPVIDLNAKSKVLFEAYGVEGTKQLFLWLNPGQYPAFPTGIQDDSHFQEFGANEVARLIIEGVQQDVGSPLSEHILSSTVTPTTAATQTPTATSTPTVTPTPTALLGDVNADGRINSVDALMALQASTGRRTLTDIQKLAADVNLSGNVNSVDALMILQFATGRRSHF